MSPEELGRRAAQILGRDKPISASAVRNQENGTNGIPWIVIDAYAKVLNLTPGWLMYGLDESGPPKVERDIPSEPISIDGIITQQWSEPSIRSSDHTLAIRVDLPAYRGVSLTAYEVADQSFEPVYKRGTFLIVAPSEFSDVRDGDHVLVMSVDAQKVLLQTIREARVGRLEGTADLIGIGANPPTPLDWFSEDTARRIYPIAVVVAAYRPVLLDSRGQKIAIPSYLFSTVEKKKAADDAVASGAPEEPSLPGDGRARVNIIRE